MSAGMHTLRGLLRLVTVCQYRRVAACHAMSQHVTAHHVLLLGSVALDGIIVLAAPVNQQQHKVATHSSSLFELPVYLLQQRQPAAVGRLGGMQHMLCVTSTAAACCVGDSFRSITCHSLLKACHVPCAALALDAAPIHHRCQKQQILASSAANNLKDVAAGPDPVTAQLFQVPAWLGQGSEPAGTRAECPESGFSGRLYHGTICWTRAQTFQAGPCDMARQLTLLLEERQVHRRHRLPQPHWRYRQPWKRHLHQLRAALNPGLPAGAGALWRTPDRDTAVAGGMHFEEPQLRPNLIQGDARLPPLA